MSQSTPSLSGRGTQSPVLLLAFNRPRQTQRVLEAIRAASVGRLYVALDGPRMDHPDDEVRCEEVGRLVSDGHWADNVYLRRRDANLGCKRGVTDGLDWFFQHEPEGIVLEDDCLPCSAFFNYCDEMLDRYRHNEGVWLVSGHNFLGTWRPGRSDYFFGQGSIWGWASWRRAWTQRDIEMDQWSDPLARARARRFLGPIGWSVSKPWYARLAAGQVDTWDYQWSWTRASHNALSVIPAWNLITNIGFGPDATHTTYSRSPVPIPHATFNPVLRGPAVAHFDRGYQTVVAIRSQLRPRFAEAARTMMHRALELVGPD